jgi:tetratricopeptide (TPR) repeat protein
LCNYESAIKYQEKHLSVAHIVGDRRSQVNALSSLGRIHSATNHFAQAINYLQQALAIAEQLANKREEEAKICHDLGLAFYNLFELFLIIFLV